MENFSLTPELIEKAKQVSSAEELIALAKENGIALSEQEAKEYFERLIKSGELTDDELDNVSGGGCFTETSEAQKLKQKYQGKRVLCKTAVCSVCGSNHGIVSKAWADKGAGDFWCEVYCFTHRDRLITKTNIPEIDLVLE